MSYADKVFIEMCRDIIDNGTAQKEKKCDQSGKTGVMRIRSRSLE